LQSLAQPATSDKNKLRDPMVMAPGYVAPDNDQIEATVITIGDYDNFKLGVDFAECSIANNPLNPKQYYAVRNSTGSSGGRGYYTNDGYTWTAGNPTWSGTMWGDVWWYRMTVLAIWLTRICMAQAPLYKVLK
jgi:hypothetical protein